MRLLICGSRDWPGAWEDIAVHLPDEDDVTIIHGACSRIDPRGVQTSVDMIVDFAARGLGHRVEAYPVDIALDGRWPGAGPSRNRRMLRESSPAKGLAFGALWKLAARNSHLDRPNGRPWRQTGTGNMVYLMLAAKLPVRWVAAPGADAVSLTMMPAPPSRSAHKSPPINNITCQPPRR